MKKKSEAYSKKESLARFTAALRGAFGKTQPKIDNKKKTLDESRKRDSKKKGSH